MTITPHGYPDWGRYAAQADVLHLLVPSETISGPTVKPRMFVGYTPWITIHLLSFVGRFRIVCNYFPDPTSGANTGVQEYHIGDTGRFDQVVPVLGPYLELTITPDAANRQYSLTVAQAASAAQRHTAGTTTPVLISATGTAVAAGATIDVDALHTFAGECHCAIEMGGVAFEAFIRVRDYLGVVTNIAYIARPAGTTGIIHPFLLMVPGQQARISVHNVTAGASAFNAYLVGRPLTPGA